MAEDLRPEAAVRAAKKWLGEVYADEPIENIGLEEVRFRDGNWEITLGFNRRNEPTPSAERRTSPKSLYAANPLASALRSVELQRRIYKVIVVAGADNGVTEMRDREAA
jgi:hypothetical protein